MHLSLTTFLVSTFVAFPLLSSAIHPQALSRSSSLVFSSRQHRVPRSILDICIDANVDLLADAPQLLDLGSNIQLCLCLKDLDIFLDTNVNIKALVGLLGKSAVSALVTALINTSPDASQCSFPPHAHHTCNNIDPCHYECDPPYVRVGNTCVCTPPYTSCNGRCDIFPKGCGSAVPRLFKARNGPITTVTQAKATCKPHETVCGIPGREGTLDFECIDIDTANDSCGGCMAPQPFPETEPVLHVSGTDCSGISNAKYSECSGQRCIVSKCKVGWLPNLTRDTCILDSNGPLKLRKVSKREGSIAINVTANADVSSDLLAKIGAIVELVSGLDCDLPSSQTPAGSGSSSDIISDLLSGVRNVTSTLIASTTVPSLLNNLDTLVNISSFLSSTLSTCECGTDLGLTDPEDALDNIVAASLSLKSWCAHNILTGLNLSDLLSGLGLDDSTVAVGAVVNPDLVDQIRSLVGLVAGLVNVGSSLPPPSPGSGSVPLAPTNLSSINTDIIDSIINATIDIVNAPTVASLVFGISELVNATGLASTLLDHCECVRPLGLGLLAATLAQVASAALNMKDWCETYPAASIPAASSSSTRASTSIPNTEELSIDIGLSNLLGLLGPVESRVVSGLRTVISTLENRFGGGGLLGTGNVSAVTPVTPAGTILNPELVTQLKGLVSLVTKLQSSYSPSGLNASILVDPNLVADIVQKTANLGSPTVISLVTDIDDLIMANSALQTALTNCACVDILGLVGVANYLVLVADATLELKNWCSSNSPVIPQPVISRSSPSFPPSNLLSVSAALAKIGPSTILAVISEPTPASTPPPSSQASESRIVIDLNHLLSGLSLNKGAVRLRPLQMD